MGQQPNIELTEADKPRRVPEPPSARRWRPTKPGLVMSPDQMPSGGFFGMAAPDGGWALRIIADADLPDEDPRLKAVLAGLMTARAALLGRAPIPQDLETALILCGYGFDAPPEVTERRQRWLAAVAHELRPGETAVAEVDRELIANRPDQIRWALGRNASSRQAD
jgi:hypothetical protein